VLNSFVTPMAALTASVALCVHAPARADQPDLATSEERATQCLTLAVAYEAGFEPLAGQQAVAEVVLNRTQHPAYPKSVCGVVFQGSARKTGCQFTFTCDGALNRHLSDSLLSASRQVAMAALAGTNPRLVAGATHYHADYVSPYWAPSLIRVGKIGAHIFYRAPNSSDNPARYVARAEPKIDTLGAWATAPDSLTQRGASVPPASTAEPTQASTRPAFAPWGIAPPPPAN
jgi:Cell Wall Hydrolase